MILYGTKGKKLHQKTIPNLQCNYCKEQRPHSFSIFGRYFYLYFIPFFPVGKTGFSECTHCKITHSPKEMNEPLKYAYNDLKNETKYPYTFFIGWLVVALIVTAVIFISKKEKENLQSYISSPEINDIVTFKSSPDSYSTLKVFKVTKDSILLKPNLKEVTKKSRIDDIEKPENYDKGAYKMSLDHYRSLFEDKEFLDVDRD